MGAVAGRGMGGFKFPCANANAGRLHSTMTHARLSRRTLRLHFCRLKLDACVEAELIVFKAKGAKGAIVDAVQVIHPGGPKTRDCNIE